MCKVFPIDSVMEGVQDNKRKNGVLSIECSKLLELSAADDLAGFVYEVEANGREIDEASFWYGRRMGTKKMGFDERTPLMIASTYGSIDVLKYIISTQKSEINRASATDGATALHCAAAGGSQLSVEAVKLLIASSADVNAVDSNGNRAADMIARYIKSLNSSKRKVLQVLLNGGQIDEQEGAIEVEEEGEKQNFTTKKEYPIDVSLPDINNGVYGSDEFRMYSFKVKPCSRAYSHDWTECPFVHPGENARRRDPRKFHYSCVPCPEFRKGSCAKSDACEYAHGVFESWLHPAQYRTRLCKEETGCARKVCFFAHKVEELRPLYASTGSAMPSPKSGSSSSSEIGPMSPLVLGSGSGSTPPMSPSVSSPLGGGNLWQNKVNLTPPTLQLHGSRLKTALNARDLELELDLIGLESVRTQQRQQLIDDLSTLASSSPSYYNNNTRFGELKPTNLDDVFGSLDHSSAAMLSQLQSLSLSSPNLSSSTIMATTSPTIRQNSNPNPLRASYPSSNYSSSPMRKPNPNASFGFDSSAAVAQAVMNSRSAAFAKRSQSFVHRGGPIKAPSNLSEWGSPDGKLDWGFNGEEASKLKKSASFGFRNNGGVAAINGRSGLQQSQSGGFHEPDVSWVNTLVKDVSSVGAGLYSSGPKNGGNVQEMMLPPWIEQMYIEQEQMVA